MNEPRPLPGVRVLPPMPEAPRVAGPGAPRPVGRRTGRAGGSPAILGRFASVNAFVDRIAADLTRSQVLAWLIVWRDTDARSGLARVAIADVARRAGASRRAAGEAIRHLCRAGLLVRVRRGGLNAGPSVFRVTADRRRQATPTGAAGSRRRGKRASS